MRYYKRGNEIEKLKNRRCISRWQLSRQAKIKLRGAENFTDCLIRDVNLRGMQVVLKICLPTDDFIRFEFSLKAGIIFSVESWVVWHKQIEGKQYYGLYFSKISQEDKERLYRLLRFQIPRQVQEEWYNRGGGDIVRGEDFLDRRIFERFPARIPVRFLDSRTNQELSAQTQDISAKGVGIVAKERLPVNTSLELWLEIPDQGEPLYTRGEVVWSKSTGANEYRAGINLEKADLMGLSRVLRV